MKYVIYRNKVILIIILLSLYLILFIYCTIFGFNLTFYSILLVFISLYIFVIFRFFMISKLFCIEKYPYIEINTKDILVKNKKKTENFRIVNIEFIELNYKGIQTYLNALFIVNSNINKIKFIRHSKTYCYKFIITSEYCDKYFINIIENWYNNGKIDLKRIKGLNFE